MIKGGGYLGVRTRQPPTAQTTKKKLMWVRGVVCRSTRTQTLTVVACVILQCITCFYKCRYMSDGVFIQFVCQFFILMVIQIKVCQRFVCIVPIASTRITWSLISLYPCLFRLAISMLCCAFAFTMVTMVTIGGDLQPGCLADRLLTGLGQLQINP